MYSNGDLISNVEIVLQCSYSIASLTCKENFVLEKTSVHVGHYATAIMQINKQFDRE